MISFIIKYEDVAVRVLVVDDFKQLRAMADQCDGAKPGTNSKDKTYAMFIPRPGGLTCGDIVLSRSGKQKLLEWVPHEITHAVMSVRKKVVEKNDEQLAYAVGALSRMVLMKLRKYGVVCA